MTGTRLWPSLAHSIPGGPRTARFGLRLLAFLVALLLPVLLASGGLAVEHKGLDGTSGTQPLVPHTIAIESQPFHTDLLRTSQRWQEAPIGQVVGESPRDTLLNFYVVMAKVYGVLQDLVANPTVEPGLFWSASTLERAREANDYLQEAITALDVHALPQSIRHDLAMEYALKLKTLLDYSFINSLEPFDIPDRAAIARLSEQHANGVGYWRIPGTSIALTDNKEGPLPAHDYFFSAETIAEIPVLYEKIRGFTPPKGDFFTPGFYEDFSATPGYILPPKWYLMLPAWLRLGLLERMAFGQTLAQLVLAALLWAVFLALSSLLLGLFFRTYRHAPSRQDDQGQLLRGRRIDMAWLRVLLIGFIPPLAWFIEVLIDDYVNITGGMLIATKSFFYIISFLGLGLLAFLSFEAVGRSISRWIVVLLGHPSDLQLRRVSNLIMPLCRVFGALVAIITFYRLLDLLGLPPQTVLAFSAVPGLAIGLGASKLLGNLFAGLSIQTDRPLKVGEFCQIGEHEGFVTKIGLRSLELNTIESRVTIPNSLVDEQKVTNYSVRGGDPAEPSLQGLDLRLAIDQPIAPFQINELFRLLNRVMADSPDLRLPFASLDPSVDDGLILTCHAQVEASDWQRYLEVRQRFIIHLRQIVSQVNLSRFRFSVAFDTPDSILQSIPSLVGEVFAAHPLVHLLSCRFLNINDFSFDYYVEYQSDQPNLDLFEEEHGRVLCALIETFRQRGIEIPLPTAVELSEHSVSLFAPAAPPAPAHS